MTRAGAGLALALAACRGPASPPDDAGWTWDLPPHLAPPEVPASNPMSAEKVELGRLLFYDFQLSVDGGRSCGICHEPAKGFTDGFVKAVGTTGELHPRNTLSTANVAYRTPLTWRNPDLVSLEEQLLLPLLGDDPIVEMGMGGQEALLVARLEAFDPYPDLFDAAFGAPPSLEGAADAIAAYERTVITADSPYDRWLQGEPGALSASAERGLDLFFGRLGCFECHSGPFLDRPVREDGTVDDQPEYYNTGLYDIDGQGGYPPDDPGLAALTGKATDTGRFRTPSLRNAALTAPYHHDGTTASLDDVLTAYARGGRLVTSGQYAGDGADNPYKDHRLTGFALTDAERADVLAFLDALTDTGAIDDPRFADPFCRDDDVVERDCVPAWEPPE